MWLWTWRTRGMWLITAGCERGGGVEGSQPGCCRGNCYRDGPTGGIVIHWVKFWQEFTEFCPEPECDFTTVFSSAGEGLKPQSRSSSLSQCLDWSWCYNWTFMSRDSVIRKDDYCFLVYQMLNSYAAVTPECKLLTRRLHQQPNCLRCRRKAETFLLHAYKPSPPPERGAAVYTQLRPEPSHTPVIYSPLYVAETASRSHRVLICTGGAERSRAGRTVFVM